MLDVGERAGRRLRYVPALDGLRGVAVAAVLLFHAQPDLLPGGHLGVSVFFTLSGFLITSLLLAERAAVGRVNLGMFWARRARRLVPAMLLCLPLVALLIRFSPQPAGSGVFGDALASVAWVANWRFILHHQSYADLFALPSPFQHFWSLGVEEQFYLAFPLFFVAVHRARRGRRWWLAGALTLLTVFSTLQLAHLNGTGADFSRAYYGTDSRMAELLVGALLAMVLVRGNGLRTFGRRVSALTQVAGLIALAGLAAGFASLSTDDARLYRGGFLVIALCTAAVIASAVQPGSPVARLLAAPPLVGLGVISYGVYLFHWPLFLLLTAQTTGLPAAPLLALRVGVTLALAVASYRLVERPARYGRLTLAGGLGGWATGALVGLSVVALAAGVISLPTSPPAVTTAQAGGPAPLAGGTAATGAVASRRAAVTRSRRGQQLKAATAQGHITTVVPLSSGPTTAGGSRAAAVPSEFLQNPSNTKVPPVPPVPPGALKVVMVGDSIGNNLGRGLLSWAKGRTDVVVYNLSIPACPFSRGRQRRLSPDQEFDVDPACAWWDDSATQRRQAFEQFAPDVVVTQDAINEVFDRRLPQWGGWRSPGQPQFDSWLSSEYQTVFGQWSSAGAKVIVTNAPCGDWTRSFQSVPNPKLRISDLNVTYDRLPGVTQADFFNRVCPNGQYSDTVEGVPNARPDGFHFTDEAAAALARNWLGPLILQTANSKIPLKP